MTGQDHSGTEPPETRAVKAALSRLAHAADRPDPTEAPAAVVAEAAGATRRLADAAAFVRTDGRERLSTAVEELRAADRTVTADRGDAVLAALSAFRAAASEAESAEPAEQTGAEAVEGNGAGAETTSAPVAERLYDGGHYRRA